MTEDDGTARDKVGRIKNLATDAGKPPRYEVIACISGRGFGVRREDMRQLIEAANGKDFTMNTLDRLVDCTDLKAFRTK